MDEDKSIKEKDLTKELEDIDEYVKAFICILEHKDRLEDIIREAKMYNLNYVTKKAQDLYDQYNQFFFSSPEEMLEARMRNSPAIREFMGGFLDFDLDQKSDADVKKEMETLLVEEGKSEELLQKYEKDLKRNPSSKEAWFGKGVVLKIVGRLEEAIQAYDETLKLDPHYKEVWYNKGIALEELGRVEDAIQAYDEALKLDPRYKEALYNKGTTLIELDRLEEALQAYDKALELDPRMKEVWLNKGVALKRVGRLEEALQAYDKALDLDPRIKAAWNNKGSVFEQLGRFDEALEAYDKALKLDPNYKSAYYGKKAVLQKLQQPQDTKDEKKTKNNKSTIQQRGGIKVAVNLTAIMDKQYQRGIEYLYKNQFDLAIIEFKKSLKRDKDLSYMKYEQLGNCYKDKGEYIEAIKYYDLALKTCPPTIQTDKFYYKKALALKNLDRNDEAIMDLNEALRQEPGLPNTWILKSNCHRAKGEYEEAIKCLDKALEIEPKNLLAWKNKSYHLAIIGNEEKAQEIFNKILTIEPIDFQSWCIKGERLVILGKLGEAMNCFNKALPLSQGHPDVLQLIKKYKPIQIKYQEIPKNLPKNAPEWNNRGLNLFRLGVYMEALACFQKAIELKPISSDFLNNRASTYYRLEMYKQAVADINEVIKLNPNDEWAWNQMGIIWFQKENFAKALECFEKSLEINPNDTLVQENKEDALNRISIQKKQKKKQKKK